MEELTKKCSKCGQIKSKGSFRQGRICRECECKYQRQRYQNDLVKDYRRKWAQEHKEKFKEYRKRFYETNKQKILEKQKNNREKNREYVRKWYITHLEESKQYYQDHKEERSEYQRQYRKTEKGKESRDRGYHKWRELGFNPLNKAFLDSVWHHINNIDVVAIPKEIHNKFIGYRTEKHRRLVLNFYDNLENMITKQNSSSNT